jgi:hypothetical protein
MHSGKIRTSANENAPSISAPAVLENFVHLAEHAGASDILRKAGNEPDLFLNDSASSWRKILRDESTPARSIRMKTLKSIYAFGIN